jgi:hypothetical protein
MNQATSNLFRGRTNTQAGTFSWLTTMSAIPCLSAVIFGSNRTTKSPCCIDSLFGYRLIPPTLPATMLAKSTVDAIVQLLQAGELSQRKIAARLGVSRGIVGSIASGRRGFYGREPDDDGELGPGMPRSPAVRCPHCGYRVYLPCLICRTREFRQSQAILRAATEARREGLRRSRRSKASRSTSPKSGIGSRHARVA